MTGAATEGAKERSDDLIKYNAITNNLLLVKSPKKYIPKKEEAKAAKTKSPKETLVMPVRPKEVLLDRYKG